MTTGSPINLLRETAPNSILYKLDGSFGLTPGGPISATVPGTDGGFPTMAVTGTAATEFTFAEIPVGEGVSDIDLSWTAAPEANRTTMNVSLRYADDSQTPNQQIFCSLVDEGEYTDVEEPDGERRPDRVIEEPGQYTDVDRDEEV